MPHPAFSIDLFGDLAGDLGGDLVDGAAHRPAGPPSGELASRLAQIERDVRSGGLFVVGASYPIDAAGEVCVRFAEGLARIPARVVFTDARGVGLELSLSPLARDALAARLAALAAAQAPSATVDAPVSSVDAPPHDEPPFAAPGDDADLGDLDALEAEEAAAAGPGHVPVHVRLRNLSVADQLKVAHRGEQRERVVLERLYGKLVWEALLRNPRVTVPEVARIARMGALPRSLIELIVGNGAWLQVPEIRRALLGNPRLPAEHIPRLLRLLPRHELKLMPTLAAYPTAVRDWARRLLRL